MRQSLRALRAPLDDYGCCQQRQRTVYRDYRLFMSRFSFYLRLTFTRFAGVADDFH